MWQQKYMLNNCYSKTQTHHIGVHCRGRELPPYDLHL